MVVTTVGYFNGALTENSCNSFPMTYTGVEDMVHDCVVEVVWHGCKSVLSRVGDLEGHMYEARTYDGKGYRTDSEDCAVAIRTEGPACDVRFMCAARCSGFLWFDLSHRSVPLEGGEDGDCHSVLTEE